MPNWTDRDIELLREGYEAGGIPMPFSDELLNKHSRKDCCRKNYELKNKEKRSQYKRKAYAQKTMDAKVEWTDEDKETLRKVYQRTSRRDRLDLSGLTKRHSKMACYKKASVLGFNRGGHSCWENSVIIRKEKYKRGCSGRNKDRIVGIWRYRECKICGKGWETLETTHRNRQFKIVRDNRIRPLKEGWNPI